MRKWFYCSLFGFVLVIACSPLKKSPVNTVSGRVYIPFEADSNRTVSYAEAIQAYTALAAQYPKHCRLTVAGMTDIGKPLHLFLLSPSGVFESMEAKKREKLAVLINNGIHPGEPEGIDASILFARDILESDSLLTAYQDLVMLIIPVYNVDGCLNRGAYSRANQNGPELHGFRGNARNLDLNRDFIKCDSENARSFTSIFQTWQPDILIDNHTSNGADYQHVITMLPTHHAKLAPVQSNLLKQEFLPFLYSDMAQKGWPMSPYVNVFGTVPDSGFVGFMDYGRYASGYASMFGCIGFVPETHMLKPFSLRLRSTYALMHSICTLGAQNRPQIKTAKQIAEAFWLTQKRLHLDFKVNLSRADTILFRGYEAGYKPSGIHGKDRLWYDRSKPFTKKIAFYDHFDPVLSVTIPKAYVVPQAWYEVIARLKANQVEMVVLQKDTLMTVEQYRIKDFKTRNAYEGHYFHYATTLESFTQTRQYYAGDLLIPTHQKNRRYIVETLEPAAPDSWFAWNFFDGILMQKEYYSDYIFEDTAEELLMGNQALKAELQQKMAKDTAFAQNPDAILDWIYLRSPYYEPTHRVYPVGRVMERG